MWERTEGKASLYSLAWPIAQRTQRWGISCPGFCAGPRSGCCASAWAIAKIERPVYDEQLRERMRETLRGEVHELRRLTGVELEGWDA